MHRGRCVFEVSASWRSARNLWTDTPASAHPAVLVSHCVQFAHLPPTHSSQGTRRSSMSAFQCRPWASAPRWALCRGHGRAGVGGQGARLGAAHVAAAERNVQTHTLGTGVWLSSSHHLLAHPTTPLRPPPDVPGDAVGRSDAAQALQLARRRAGGGHHGRLLRLLCAGAHSQQVGRPAGGGVGGTVCCLFGRGNGRGHLVSC